MSEVLASDLLIEAQGLGKSYPKVHRPSDRVRALGRLLFGNPNQDSITVLRDISLRVPRGESVGIIGDNGAGKSTLLKLISGVLTPTTGSVTVHGKVGALLELGAGFHPEFTGRDNITMTAALAGLSGEALREKLPGIIEFADIGSYIDEPIKHYSSGMVVRLGFAVIASLRPELLITDEVLAVGDESFQKKCVQWLERYLEDGGTLLLVSHSMYHIQKLCRHACWHTGLWVQQRRRWRGDRCARRRPRICLRDRIHQPEASSGQLHHPCPFDGYRRPAPVRHLHAWSGGARRDPGNGHGSFATSLAGTAGQRRRR